MADAFFETVCVTASASNSRAFNDVGRDAQRKRVNKRERHSESVCREVSASQASGERESEESMLLFIRSAVLRIVQMELDGVWRE